MPNKRNEKLPTTFREYAKKHKRRGKPAVYWEVLERDNWKCRRCGEEYRVLEVHHIIPKAKGGSDDPDNLITLCWPCHMRAHRERRWKLRYGTTNINEIKNIILKGEY